MKSSLAWSALSLCVAGCLGRGPGSPEPGVPPPAAEGRCAGWAIECYRFVDYDPSSCSFHEGCDWDPTYTEDCEGAQRFCDTYFERDGCVAQLGCRWEGTDGTVERAPRIVVCDGTAVPCESYPTRETCNPQRGCGWTYDGRCTRGGDIVGGRYWEEYPRDCGWYSTDGTGGFHPLAALEYCDEIPGCEARVEDAATDPGTGAPPGGTDGPSGPVPP